MAKANRTTSSDNDRFDEYLRERFAELKRELDAQLNAGKLKAGVLQNWKPRRSRVGWGRWTMGIAALLLVAVSVPLMLRLNQEREEARTAITKPDPASATRESKSNSGGFDTVDTAEANATGLNSKDQRTERGEITEGAPDVSGARLPTRQRTQRSDVETGAAAQSSEAGATAASSARSVAAPPAAPKPETPMREQAKGEDSGDLLAADGESAEPVVKTRSAPINDAQFRLKQTEIEAIEKAEMEQLWKEYEKNPEHFSRDRQKLQRLKQLLARYDTKSRARRMVTP